ncbi:exopolyphosphatase [Solitalea lacus]|uniref:Ppx/GppA phosphatase family protein n=1 Tax=Solitalea lacus TaxID=2911172 RepID=UPI001EDA2374|nr:exopolyphosphatase [Solitalea lacus]UKJ09336.1 exopolyphosphatase [Solitalea lacus]
MKLAVIDMGTNTFHLLIAELKNGFMSEVYKENIPVKLGEGGINRRLITEAAFERGINAVKHFEEKVLENNIEALKIIGTSALRNAHNGAEFAAKVKEITNYDVEIIDGDKEAEFIYLGVKEAINLYHHKSLIMDIGGGSVEFIICDENQMFWKQSFEIGASRLIQKFKLSDPITSDEINELEAYFDQTLEQLFTAAKEISVDQIVGSAGSFETFADMIGHRFYTPELIDELTTYEFKKSEFDAIYEQLIHSTHKERLRTPGIITMRVDMIVVAAVLTNFIRKKLGLDRMHLSTYALKEGVLSEMAREINNLVN